MNRRLSGFEINRDIAVNRVTIQKILLDHLALVSNGNDKFVDAMNIGFGRRFVSSLNLIPIPPARITAFMMLCPPRRA
jgi:hypothetical protein